MLWTNVSFVFLSQKDTTELANRAILTEVNKEGLHFSAYQVPKHPNSSTYIWIREYDMIPVSEKEAGLNYYFRVDEERRVFYYKPLTKKIQLRPQKAQV